jgi:muramidase (phage lysozyme)
MGDNRKAFRDMIAMSELGAALIAASDNGYNVLVGSTPKHPILFSDYSKHPDILNRPLDSTAAGRYQIVHGTYLSLCKMLGSYDFYPEDQDDMCDKLVCQRKAQADVDAGNLNEAILKCSNEWASLPGGNSGQHQNSFSDLRSWYLAAGGTLAAA